METDDLKILAIDDNRDNLMALKAVLSDRLPGYKLLTALDGPKGLELALAEDPVVILLDIVMPGMDGFEVCRKLKNDEYLQAIPVLFLTALRSDRDNRIKALEVGADGFLTKPLDEVELVAQIRAMAKIKAANKLLRMEKEQLLALVAERTKELEQELEERKKAENDLQRNELRLKRLVDILQHPSETIQEFLDYALDQAIQMTESRIGYIYHYHEDRQEFVLNTWSKEVMAGCAVANPLTCYALDKTGIWGEAVRQRRPIIVNDFLTENPLKKGYPEGHVHLRKFMTVPIFHDNSIVGVVGLANKITDYDAADILHVSLMMEAVWKVIEHIQAVEELRLSEERLRFAIEGSQSGFWDWNIETDEVLRNEGCATMLGYSFQEFETTVRQWKDFIHPEDRDVAWQSLQDHLAGRTPLYEIEYRMVTKDGSYVWILDRARIVQRGSQGQPLRMTGIKTNITASKMMEEEKSSLTTQLLQAQKMESVGRLAGGVAHDFNNMLSVILGHAELALMKMDPSQPLFNDLEEIRKAADRSADLTRQLLAFARKQTIAPQVLDLNVTVSGMLKLLQRLIGENIDLVWQPEADLWPINLDPAQVDQILANLCVNARDAIADVGKVTIETGNRTLNNDYCTSHPGFAPGEYVLIAVRDSGCGMDNETKAHIFEPFFTSKEIGKGTGLGLSTVYGIVKQNNGFIEVYSEPEQETIFKIFLPRYMGKAELVQLNGGERSTLHGNETILLVEDEPAILEVITELLETEGYVVVSSSIPGEAIRLAREHPGEIHLLLTDVIMPEMNGRDLAKNLLSLYPHLKRLFMSGYTADVIAHHGVLEDGVHFIQKPFSVQNLAIKVRDVLDGQL